MPLAVESMGVSHSSSELIYDSLKAAGVRVISALPETWLQHLIQMAEDDGEMTLVRVAKEEEGVGVSMGAHLAGVRSAMLMDVTDLGLLENRFEFQRHLKSLRETAPEV